VDYVDCTKHVIAYIRDNVQHLRISRSAEADVEVMGVFTSRQRRYTLYSMYFVSVYSVRMYVCYRP